MHEAQPSNNLMSSTLRLIINKADFTSDHQGKPLRTGSSIEGSYSMGGCGW